MRRILLLSLLLFPLFAGENQVHELHHRLIQAMTQEGAFDLEETRYQEVLDGMRQAKGKKSFGITLLLWEEGEIRDPDILLNALLEKEQDNKIIQLASQIYQLRSLEQTEGVKLEEMRATPWSVVQRENAYKWAEEVSSSTKGISPTLEKELNALIQRHHEESD